MKFASLEVFLGGGWGLLVYPILIFYLPLSGRSPGMTELFLTENNWANKNPIYIFEY